MPRRLWGAAKASHENKLRRLAEEAAARQVASEAVEEVQPVAGEAAVHQITGEALGAQQIASEAAPKASSEPHNSEPPSPPTPEIDMNEMPRQEDLRQASMNQVQAEEEIIISEVDIHTLLAFAQLVTQRLMKTNTLERRTLLSNEAEPREYATRQPWRLAKCLDSLASICVEKEKSEVIAIALRYGTENDQKILEIIISGNDDVPARTVDYIERIWSILRKISAALHGGEYHENDDTPTHVQNKQVQQLIKNFEIEVIKFTYNRIYKKLFAKSNVFEKFDTSASAHRMVRDTINRIDEIIREEGQSKPKHRLDDEDWELLKDNLKTLPKSVEKLIQQFMGPSSDEIPRSAFEKYLRKISGIAADFNVLMRAACSPRCKDIFSISPNIIALKKEQSTNASFPNSADAWKTQMQRPLVFYRSTESKIMPNETFKEHCELIAKKNHYQHLSVHCEVKLAVHLFHEQNDQTSPKPKAYPYIGVSKLSCIGCCHFLAAFNQIHGTRFLTKGQHSKAYFPWGFPENLHKRDEVLKQHHANLNAWFVPWYTGYISPTLVGPDSTAQSNPSGSSIIPEPTEEEIAERQQRKYSKKRKLEGLKEEEDNE